MNIKANELRIGNYLFDREDRLCKVTLIENRKPEYEEDQLFRASSIKGSITSLPNKPIPLTEEWLLKLGFKWDGFYNASDRYTSQSPVVLFKGNGYYLLKSYPLCKIKYIHELQNIYFLLTGEELVLK